MINNFATCLAFTLAEEGGFSDNPSDPGKATNMGIDTPTLSAWLGRPATVEDVRSLTRATVTLIYERCYWLPINGDNLPSGVDLMTFDAGVNMGPGTSARLLQTLVGVTADGIIGPATLTALSRHQPDWLIAGLHLAHERYYRGLGGFSEFGVGWTARNDRAVAAANGMVGEKVAPG
jgi:lysozyme family protein